MYIAFDEPDDAEKAVSTLDSTTINGNVISVKHSGQKKKMIRKKGWEAEHEPATNVGMIEGEEDEVLDIKTEKLDEGYGDEVKPDVKPAHFNNKKREWPKRSERKLKKDRCVIVRNLSFQVSGKMGI